MSLILIEAPSSAYRRGMLSWITVTHTTKIAYKANRAGVAERFPAPAVPKSIAVDLALLGHDDQLRRARELSGLTTAQQHDATTLSRRRPVPGLGAILSLGLL